MPTLLVMVLLMGSTPGPLDAFRANRADILVDLEFVQETGKVDPSALKDGITSAVERGFIPEPLLKVTGRWESDGTTEHLVYGNPPDIAQLWAKQGNTGQLTSERRNMEVLFDGETAAWHILDGSDRLLHVVKTQQALQVSHGPFYWVSLAPFPDYVLDDFAGVEPSLKRVTLEGRPVEVEVYRKDRPNSWYQAEVYYDPSTGYLPRFIRLIGSYRGQRGENIARVKELNMLDTRACSAGGFVPTEWIHLSFSIDDFERKYPAYRLGTSLEPTGTVAMSRFEATSFKDRIAPVRLDRLDSVMAISAVGGIIKLNRPPSTLTLAQVKGLVGRKRLTEPQNPAVLAGIDTEELHKFERGMQRREWLYYAVVLICVVACTWLIFRRRFGKFGGWARTGIVAFVGIPIAGCGTSAQPVVRLTARFTPERLIYDSRTSVLPLTLAVKNEGTLPIQIFNINGGCSCRKVDRTKLPSRIRPGEEMQVTVHFQSNKLHDPQKYVFQFETDHGLLGAPAMLLALPNHYLTPASIALTSLIDVEEGKFELTHQSVLRSGQAAPPSELVVPPPLHKEEIQTRQGRVVGASEFVAIDKTVRITIKDSALGLHRAEIFLRTSEGDQLASVPITWRKVPFLSSTPDRVVLGRRAVRVFLRCPDEAVELKEIRSVPRGVRATIRSTHEMTIEHDDSAGGSIDGSVEVLTTADSHPPLRIPVVRYAPEASVSRASNEPQIGQ